MPPESRSTLATAFAVVAIIAALASATASAVTAARLAHKIQVQRVEAVAANCRDVNERHDATIEKLDGLIAKLPPAQQERARTNRASTVFLIEALVPDRPDCDAYAKSVVHP